MDLETSTRPRVSPTRMPRRFEAGERVLAEYREREDQLASLDTLADLDDYAAALSAGGSRLRFTEACQELQTIADQDNIDADLGCT